MSGKTHTEYTPTTEEVRKRYWLNDGEPSDPDEALEFDRWLAAHDREVAAKAIAGAEC